MPKRNPSLHGAVPEKCKTALLLVDVINDFEFPGGGDLFSRALPAARCLRRLKRRTKRAGIPVIYANDNFGRWQSDFRAQVDHCLNDGVRGEEVVKLLLPDEDDFFVLKPKHSGFFASSLGLLLGYLGVETLIIAGFAGDICVLYTVNDAYMRDFHLIIPADCIASETPEGNRHALAHMRRYLRARTPDSKRLRLPRKNRK